MATFVSASFTVGSDTALASYTPETGGPIVLHPSYTGSTLVDASLDRAYLSSAAAAAYYATGSPASADYEVQTDFFRLTTMSINVGLAMAVDTSADTMIMLRLNDNGTAQVWEVIDRTTGSNVVLGTSVLNIPSNGGAGVTMRMVRTGTTMTVFANGVQDTSFGALTTTITAIGKAGFRFSGTASSTTGIHIDNWSATDASVAQGDPFRVNNLRPAIFKPGRAR